MHRMHRTHQAHRARQVLGRVVKALRPYAPLKSASETRIGVLRRMPPARSHITACCMRSGWRGCMKGSRITGLVKRCMN